MACDLSQSALLIFDSIILFHGLSTSAKLECSTSVKYPFYSTNIQDSKSSPWNVQIQLSLLKYYLFLNSCSTFGGPLILLDYIVL